MKRATITIGGDLEKALHTYTSRQEVAPSFTALVQAALREYLEGKAPRLEETLRRIIREELKSNAA